jgi:HEAT repeat protein
MRPAFALAARLSTACLVLASTATVTQAAPPAAASKLTPKDNAVFVLRSGIKSADFTARGMAYRGLAQDKANKEVKKLLEDGMTDPQWTVRRGVAEAFYALGDARWKKLVHEALALPVLSPYEVLPLLDDVAHKDATAVLLETLADKENGQQDVIVKALVGRNRPDLGEFLKTALTSKDPLVVQSVKKGIAQLDPVLQGKALDTVAKAAAGDDAVVTLLADIAAAADDRIPTPWLASLKPKDAKLQGRIVLLRANHGDKTVGRSLLALAKASTGKDKIEALQAYRKVIDKADVAAVKAQLEGANSDVIFQVYEILARMGDRSMAADAQKLAESTDVDVRAPGVFYLGWVGGAGRLAEMHGYLKDGIPGVRIAAARVLGFIGSKVSVGPLRDALDAEQVPTVRIELIKALTGIHDKEGYLALIGYSKERDPELRRLIIKALAESGDKDVRSGLSTALNDNDPRIRFEAVRGFLLSDPAEAVKVWKRAIRWLPRGALLELTREMAKTMEGFLEIAVFDSARDEQGAAVREEALVSLHLLPEAEGRILHKVLNTSDDQDLRVRMLGRLFELEGKKVATEIKTAALGQQVRARVMAIRMLAKLKGDKEASELLVRFLDEPDERVRIAAALTLLGG